MSFMDEWIKIYIQRQIDRQIDAHTHETEYYLAIKGRDPAICIKWTNLEDIMLSEINSTERQIQNNLTCMYNLKKS